MLASDSLPRCHVVDRREGCVLRQHESRRARTEASVGDQARSGLVRGQRTGGAADGLHVDIRERRSLRPRRASLFPCRRAARCCARRPEHGVAGRGARRRANAIRIVILRAGDRNRGDRRAHGAVDGQRRPGIERHDQQHRLIVGRAGFGEGCRRVSGRRDDQRPPFALREAAENREGLEIFERAGRQGRAALRPPAVEGNPQVRQTKPVPEGLAAVDSGPGHGRDRPAQRQPFPVAQYGRLGTGSEALRRIAAAQERRRVAVGALEEQTVVIRERGRTAATPEGVARYRVRARCIRKREGPHP